MSEIEREYLEEEEEQEQETGFTVVDDEKAEWCLSKIKEHKEQIEMWTAHYEAEKKRACMVHENAIFKLETKLRDYFMTRMDEGLTRETKTMKAYNLPHGKLCLKKQDPEFEKDEDVMVQWLEQNNPELVKVKKSPDWAGMKKTYGLTMSVVDEETGEIIKIPGVTVIPREDVFKVEVK